MVDYFGLVETGSFAAMNAVKCIVIHVHTVCIYIYVSKISTDIFA